MNYLFVRHGETDWNVLGKIQGRTDIPLNNNGIIQVKNLCLKINSMNPELKKIYTSVQIRAVQTAKLISEYSGLNFESINGIEEVNFGLWEGLSWTEVKSEYPKEYEEWIKNQRYAKTPNGESYQNTL